MTVQEKRTMTTKILATRLITFVLLTVAIAACASPAQAPASPTALLFVTETLPALPTGTVSVSTPAVDTPVPTTDNSTAQPIATATSAPASNATPASSANFCADPQVTALIDSLKKAVTTADGPLLASLVSPASGMDVAFYHNGNVVNYDQEHAKFLFETTFEADWGTHPASGEEKTGSFHDVVVPELVKSFGQPYTLYCNELKHGGASYPVTFPYKKDYYSVYYPGTNANGNMDWHTWVVGIEYVNGKPYVYALEQFFWEP
jgi:hypothetical protein